LTDGPQALLAFAGAGAIALIAVPAARRVADATGFMDHPVSYKKHARSTPYLGGAAVIAAFMIAASLLGSAWSSFSTVMLLVLVLTAMGTIDDRRTLGPGLRFGLQLAAAAVLWAEGIRWELFGVAALDLPITLIWVAGLTNAFNLLDNIDGAAATTAAVSAAGIGAIALAEGSGDLATLAFALSGACAAFLVFNLACPSKIFLGDGGSLPLGFLIAALAMLLPTSLGNEALLAAVPLAGIAIFDTSLVVLSRTRRGISILVGGRDHSTHRLLHRLGSPRRVALALAGAQAALCGLAFGMQDLGSEAVAIVAIAYVLAGAAVLALFEAPALAPQPVEQSA